LVIYPNPWTGGPVHLLVPGTGVATVKVEVFTTAFRKVLVKNFEAIPLGTPGSGPTIDMMDQWGNPLGNGLYYVVVSTVPQSGSGGSPLWMVGKMLLLR
jgi:hypothetical protein